MCVILAFLLYLFMILRDGVAEGGGCIQIGLFNLIVYCLKWKTKINLLNLEITITEPLL